MSDIIMTRRNLKRTKRPFRYTYSGQSDYTEDAAGNWELRLLTSGTLTIQSTKLVDIFAVGGGAGGDAGLRAGSANKYLGGTGGGGGYTATTRGIYMPSQTQYTVTVGAGGASDAHGGASGITGAGVSLSAAGGKNGYQLYYEKTGTYARGNQGNGGSGGGWIGGNGGSDGSNGYDYDGSLTPDSKDAGQGQHTTTRAFGDSTGELFAGGGAGGRRYNNASPDTIQNEAGTGGAGGGADGGKDGHGADAPANTGGGGGGGSGIKGSSTMSGDDAYAGGHGGSGIVIIRNAR